MSKKIKYPHTCWVEEYCRLFQVHTTVKCDCTLPTKAFPPLTPCKVLVLKGARHKETCCWYSIQPITIKCVYKQHVLSHSMCHACPGLINRRNLCKLKMWHCRASAFSIQKVRVNKDSSQAEGSMCLTELLDKNSSQRTKSRKNCILICLLVLTFLWSFSLYFLSTQFTKLSYPWRDRVRFFSSLLWAGHHRSSFVAQGGYSLLFVLTDQVLLWILSILFYRYPVGSYWSLPFNTVIRHSETTTCFLHGTVKGHISQSLALNHNSYISILCNGTVEVRHWSMICS